MVILNDNHTHQSHAVLIVDVDNVSYLLDNQIQKVVPATSVTYYKPQYALNEQGWWQIA